MKQRFSSLDVKVIAHELSASLSTLRVANVYDLSSRIFLLKLAKPDNRQQLVIDSGFRCHLTTYSRATAAAPSAFVTRLRKYLRTRRITSVSQVGTDRIIEIQLGDGAYRLFLEFYAGGNIVLTDQELNILALLRIVSPGTDQEELRVGLKYSLYNRQNYGGVPPLTKERIRDALQKAVDGDTGEDVSATKKSKRKATNQLRKALAVSVTEYPPMLVEHALCVTKFDAQLRPEQVLQDDSLLDRLLSTLIEAGRVTQDITSSAISTGYIIAKVAKRSQQSDESEAKLADQAASDGQNLLYEDFHPFKPKQFEDDPDARILTFDGFNKAVDEFYSSIEGQKLEGRLQSREETAKRKKEAARTDHEKRIGALQEVQELNVRKAEAIEANVPRVEEATAAVNGLVSQGMDWVEIARLIEMEQKRHNPVAELIKIPLKLYENTVTLLLGEVDEEDDYEGDETDTDSASESDEEERPKKTGTHVIDKRLAIDIDLGLSPWANARHYYDHKRTAVIKEQKTLQSSAKALKSTEKKIESDLKRSLKQEKQLLRPVRRQLWFEKFLYFISSDGYLVLGGKDAQQNEMLYKRYFKRGDIYVHADLHGAATVIIKNNSSTPDAPIPPSTLSQAGNLSVATSKAWESRAVMPAWWVYWDQVSKSAPTGEFLPTGSFMVRGKKNFLPPAQLLLGFAVMFQITEESKARHVKHRLRTEGSVDQKKGKDAHESASEVAEGGEFVQAIDNMSLKDVEENEEKDHSGDNQGDEDEDDDEDFPDARLDSESESEGVYISDNGRSNPLQTARGDHTEKGDSDTDEDAENEHHSDDINEQHNRSMSVSLDGKPIDENAAHSGGVRHLSARDRKFLRRGQESLPPSSSNGNEGDDRPQSSSEDVASMSTSTAQHPDSKAQQQSSSAQKPRGKRGKQKKLATKYANQTAEDRAIAMSLLGSTAAEQKAVIDANAKQDREAEIASQRQRRREQHQKTARETAEHEEIRRLMHDEGIETLESEEDTLLLDTFVGTPLPGDEILEAIPVCAPWTALGKYKYKAKLQPGSTKKGKAVKEILGRWMAVAGAGGGGGTGKSKAVDERSEDTEKMWPREVELLKTWRDVEVLNTVPVSKLRVMMGGGGGGGKAGGSGGGAGSGKGKAKGKGRGGRGSKKK
ncbi:MAG: hypothetical protein M1837_006082 [Sclerophora amabilis]|nr:MAG: hypothetical protein M1837_006082 [Sclerophora amabilis]